jgi:hypothetical protein
MTLPFKFFKQSGPPVDAALSRRLGESIESVGYWVQRMPREAAHLAHKSRVYTIAAAVLSLFTGFLAWPVIAESSPLTAQVLVSSLSFLAAFTVAAPHVLGLSDRGDESIKLCGTYAAMYRELLDVRDKITAGSMKDPSRVADLIRQFERIQKRKDATLLAGYGRTKSASGMGPITDAGRRGEVASDRLPETVKPLPVPTGALAHLEATVTTDDQALLAALVHALRSGHVEVRRHARYRPARRRFPLWPQAVSGRHLDHRAVLEELAGRVLWNGAPVILDSARARVTKSGGSTYLWASNGVKPGSTMRILPDTIGAPLALCASTGTAPRRHGMEPASPGSQD